MQVVRATDLPPIAKSASSAKQHAQSATSYNQSAICHGTVVLSACSRHLCSSWLFQAAAPPAAASTLMTINELVDCLAPCTPSAAKQAALQELCRRASTGEKLAIETYINLHPHAVNHLLELLATADAILKAAAVLAVMKLLKPTAELRKRMGRQQGVITALVTMLSDCSHKVQAVAADAIAWTVENSRSNQEAVMQQPGAVAALLGLMGSREAAVRKSAVSAVGCVVHGNAKTAERIGQIDKTAVMLVQLLGDSNSAVRREAAWAIRSFVEGNTANQERIGQQCGAVEKLLEQEKRRDGLYAKLALKALVNNNPNNIRRKVAAQTGFAWISS